MPASGSHAFTISILVDSAAPESSLLLGTASATAATADPTSNNNVDIVSTIGTTVAQADIETVSSGPGPIGPGQSGNVIIDVTNLGLSDTGNPTVVTYIAPTGTTIDMANIPGSCVPTGPGVDNSVLCTVDALVADESEQLQLPIVMPSSASPGSTLSGGSATGVNPDDSNMSNDIAAGSVVVGPAESNLTTVIADPGPMPPAVQLRCSSPPRTTDRLTPRSPR